MRILMLLFMAVLSLGTGASWGAGVDVRITRDWWPGSTLQREARYAGEVLDGVYRTWYQDGRPYEVRHYVNGREQGLQQAWTPNGDLYLNYEMRNGRRYGYVNAQPCLPVVEENVMP
jgi:antitoxin component YwqK of YwqJK toxin-antitoxin module